MAAPMDLQDFARKVASEGIFEVLAQGVMAADVPEGDLRELWDEAQMLRGKLASVVGEIFSFLDVAPLDREDSGYYGRLPARRDTPARPGEFVDKSGW